MNELGRVKMWEKKGYEKGKKKEGKKVEKGGGSERERIRYR